MQTELVFNPFLPEMRSDPYPVYRRLREEDPVHYSPVIRSWVLSRHADVVAFFSDDERLSSDRSKAKKYRGTAPAALGTFQSDPPQHTRIRTLVTKAFTPRVIDGMRERIATVVDGLLDAMAASDEADLIAQFARPLPMTVISEILGVPPSDHEKFHRWGRAFAEAVDHVYAKPKGQDGGSEMANYFAQLVPKRRAAPEDDLISQLLAASDGADALSIGEVIAVLAALLFAGHETTVNLIGNGALTLLRNPDQLVRVRDGDVARTAVEELLRYESPAQIISRSSLQTVELGGKTIEKGDSVIALLGAANRDPEVFSDPEGVDVERSPNPHVAFGHGIHFCVGAQLSRLEGRIAIPALLRRFPNARFATDRPHWRETAVLRGLETLPIRLG
jgi:pimeloyl-[acyl-carrier protein] synthase